MTQEPTPVYQPRDVVYGSDPFKQGEAGRPWLVVSNFPDRPFHGDQYVALTLTTKSWMDGLIDVQEDDWVRGGTPEPSRIVPWGVQSLGVEEIDHWQGRIAQAPFEEAVDALVAELR